MALIQTVEPDKAEDQAKEIYDFMQKNAGVIPAPLQLASASPRMLDMVWQSIQYYSQHPNEDFQNGSDVLNSQFRKNRGRQEFGKRMEMGQN